MTEPLAKRDLRDTLRWTLTWLVIICSIIGLIGIAAAGLKSMLLPPPYKVSTSPAAQWHPPLIPDEEWNLFHKEGR